MEVALKTTRRTDSLHSAHDQELGIFLGSDQQRLLQTQLCREPLPCPHRNKRDYHRILQDWTQPEVSGYQLLGVWDEGLQGKQLAAAPQVLCRAYGCVARFKSCGVGREYHSQIQRLRLRPRHEACLEIQANLGYTAHCSGIPKSTKATVLVPVPGPVACGAGPPPQINWPRS